MSELGRQSKTNLDNSRLNQILFQTLELQAVKSNNLIQLFQITCDVSTNLNMVLRSFRLLQ